MKFLMATTLKVLHDEQGCDVAAATPYGMDEAGEHQTRHPECGEEVAIQLLSTGTYGRCKSCGVEDWWAAQELLAEQENAYRRTEARKEMRR